jgi:hypothetical protein
MRAASASRSSRQALHSSSKTLQMEPGNGRYCSGVTSLLMMS